MADFKAQWIKRRIGTSIRTGTSAKFSLRDRNRNPNYAPLLSALAGGVSAGMAMRLPVGPLRHLEFWAYIAIVAAVSVLSLAILDTNIVQE